MWKTWPRFERVDFTILWPAGSRSAMRGSESSSRATTGKRGSECLRRVIRIRRNRRCASSVDSEGTRFTFSALARGANRERPVAGRKKNSPGIRSAPGTLPAGSPLLPDGLRSRAQNLALARGQREKKHRGKTGRRLRAEDRPAGPDRRGDLAHLHLADAGGGGLPGHEESATGAAHLPPSGKAHADAYLPLCPGLPSAGGHREALPGSRRAHLLVDPARTTAHAPGSHGGVADQGGKGAEDPQGHHSGTAPPRNLYDAADSSGDHEAGQDLA